MKTKLCGKAKDKTAAISALALLIVIFPLRQLVRAQEDPSAASEARQTEAAQSLSLPLAVDIALRTNPLLRATTSGRDIADAQLEEARASRYPFVQLNQTFTTSNNPVFVFGSLLEQGRFGAQNFDPNVLNHPDALSNFRSSVSLRLPVFNQRQTDTRISEAQLAQQQAAAARRLAEQQIRFEVVRAYYGLLIAEARKEVADEAVRLAEADVKRLRDLFETGMIVQSDLLAVEVQQAEFRQQQIQAEGDISVARAALNTALGITIDTPQKIVSQLLEKKFVIETQEELIRQALLHRPELTRARLSSQAAKERVGGAKGEWLPRLDLFANLGFSSEALTGGSSDYTVGASVTFNLFDAGRKARIAQAQAAESATAAEEERLASQIRFEAVRAYQQFVSAREQLAVAARIVAQAREALRIVKDRYEAGLTTITEVLRAETTFVRARLMLLAARYDHYLGYANVLLASGRLTSVEPFAS